MMQELLTGRTPVAIRPAVREARQMDEAVSRKWTLANPANGRYPGRHMDGSA